MHNEENESILLLVSLEVHTTRLKYNHDACLDECSIAPRVLYFEKGMKIQRLQNWIDTASSLLAKLCWRGLPAFENMTELRANVYEDVPFLLTKLFYPKNITSERL